MKRTAKLSVTLAMMLMGMGASAEVKMQEIRTSADNVIQIWFRSDKVDVNEVSVDNPQAWKVDGKPALKLSRSAAPFEKECDHYVYLTVPTLKDGKTYKISTPFGNYDFKFDDDTVFCESIKTNQAAYSALSTKRFANFAIYLGDAGSRKIEGKIPSYKVVRTSDGKQITSGTLAEIGQDASSGDYVYRMDLSAVPEGGPYKVVVAGYGTSYPFAVGGEFSQRLSYLSFRALLNQRCGIQLEEPYVEHSYRHDKCHEVIYQTHYPINEAKLPVNGDEPTIRAWGGYHDAGDADRRTYHMIVPSTLLTTYEAFSSLFTDDQFNIPDIFDEEFNILGKGNKIPDILDEAEWGTMFWKYFQEEDGQIPWGTETMGYSPFTTYDREDHLFGSEVLDSRTSAWASGLFYHFARLIQPYDKAKAAEYQSRAELAWKASNKAYAEAGRQMAGTFQMYYNVEKYLMTGDQDCHSYIRQHASDALALADTYNTGTEAFANQAWLVSYFFSYVLAPASKTDAATVAVFKEAVRKAADKQVDLLNVNAYPNGVPQNVNWWGSNVAQGQYSYPMIMMWKLTGEQKYIDTVSQMMDYALGLNPLGKCFMTQIGFNRAEYPHDRESAYTLEMGWGSRPGIMIFGPGNYANYPAYPAIRRGQTPRERAYVEIVDNYMNNEFTIYQSLCFPAAIYPILSNGVNGNDHSKDPYGYKTY